MADRPNVKRKPRPYGAGGFGRSLYGRFRLLWEPDAPCAPPWQPDTPCTPSWQPSEGPCAPSWVTPQPCTTR